MLMIRLCITSDGDEASLPTLGKDSSFSRFDDTVLVFEEP